LGRIREKRRQGKELKGDKVTQKRGFVTIVSQSEELGYGKWQPKKLRNVYGKRGKR